MRARSCSACRASCRTRPHPAPRQACAAAQPLIWATFWATSRCGSGPCPERQKRHVEGAEGPRHRAGTLRKKACSSTPGVLNVFEMAPTAQIKMSYGSSKACSLRPQDVAQHQLQAPCSPGPGGGAQLEGAGTAGRSRTGGCPATACYSGTATLSHWGPGPDIQPAGTAPCLRAHSHRFSLMRQRAQGFSTARMPSAMVSFVRTCAAVT